MRPENSVVQTIFFKKNIIKLDDSILGLFGGQKVDYFYHISKKDTFLSDEELGPGKNLYFYQILKFDTEYDIYERNVYNVIGVLKDIGGFYSSLYFVGLVLYSQLQGSVMF